MHPKHSIQLILMLLAVWDYLVKSIPFLIDQIMYDFSFERSLLEKYEKEKKAEQHRIRHVLDQKRKLKEKMAPGLHQILQVQQASTEALRERTASEKSIVRSLIWFTIGKPNLSELERIWNRIQPRTRPKYRRPDRTPENHFRSRTPFKPINLFSSTT